MLIYAILIPSKKEVATMKYLLMKEYETMKVYEMDNVIYKKIEYKFVKFTGSEQMAKSWCSSLALSLLNSWAAIL